MQELQLYKLRRLLNQCRNHVPFYRDYVDPTVLSADRSPLEILSNLPIVDKAYLKSHYDSLIPENLDALPQVRISRTGGTTGEPFQFFRDRDRVDSVWAAFYRFYDWMQVGLDTPKVVLWGEPIVRLSTPRRFRRAVLDRIDRTVRIDTFRQGALGLRYLRRVFESHRPQLLRGYTQAVVELARLFHDDGFFFPLRAVTTTAEPLRDRHRDIIRTAFGCETFDQYGCSEVESVAFECPAHLGLHVARERCVVEIDNDREIVLTDLDNMAFPFIRYRTGDTVRFANEPCLCGRPGLRLAAIQGRSGDMVHTSDGRTLHPEFFTHLINETGISHRRDVKRYQVVQTGPNEIHWNFVSDTLNASDCSALTTLLHKYLPQADVTIKNVPHIPSERSGKFRYVVGWRPPAHSGADENT